MKSVELVAVREWYCDCPYCNSLLQFFHSSPDENETVKCEFCNKQFKIKSVENRL